jgi:hypothetical protein
VDRHSRTTQIKHLSSSLAQYNLVTLLIEVSRIWLFGREMQQPDNSLRSGESFRQLRAITILTYFLGVALLVPYGIISDLNFTIMGLIPMTFSMVLGSLMYTNVLQSPNKKAIIDITLTVVYLVVLMPR